MLIVSELLIALIFGIWLFFTICKNFISSSRVNKLSYFNTLLNSRFIPSWFFFAPYPASHSLYFLFRDKLRNGQMTKWQKITINSKIDGLCIIWNPTQNLDKVIHDIAVDLERHYNQESIKLSVPYQAILSYVINIPRTTDPIATQFLCIRNSLQNGSEILFI